MKGPKLKNGLTPQEECAVQELAYMCDVQRYADLEGDNNFRACQYLAYKKAYPNTKASVDSLYVMASRLFNKVKVRLRFDEIMQQQMDRAAKRHAMDKERIIGELKELADLDPRDFYIMDRQTGVMRVRKKYELSKKAHRAVVRMTRYGYDTINYLDVIRKISEICGWDADKNVNLNAGNSLLGEIRFGFNED